MNMKMIVSLTMVAFIMIACSKSDDDAKTTSSESLSDKAASAISTMKETSSKVAGETMEKAKSAAEEAATFVKKGSSQVVTAVEDAKEGLANTVETVREKAADMMSDTSAVEEKATDVMADTAASGTMTESQSVDNSAEAATAMAAGSVDAGKKAVEDKMSVASVTEKTVTAPASNLDLQAGKSVYTGKCVVCHGSGAAGAPKLDDPSWSARNAQGMDVLVDHAIKGYQGSKGYMPAKGGFMALSDEEVKNAVAYMVDTSKK